MKKTTRFYVLAFAALLVTGGVLTHPARADRDDWRGHATKAREWHRQHWRNGHIVYEHGGPYVTYAPPVVVEPPPPVYNEEQPSINFVVPLNIR